MLKGGSVMWDIYTVVETLFPNVKVVMEMKINDIDELLLIDAK